MTRINPYRVLLVVVAFAAIALPFMVSPPPLEEPLPPRTGPYALIVTRTAIIDVLPTLTGCNAVVSRWLVDTLPEDGWVPGAACH